MRADRHHALTVPRFVVSSAGNQRNEGAAARRGIRRLPGDRRAHFLDARMGIDSPRLKSRNGGCSPPRSTHWPLRKWVEVLETSTLFRRAHAQRHRNQLFRQDIAWPTGDL
jgi:hypothetical protein